MSDMLEAARQMALLARLGYPMADGLKAMADASPWLGRVGEDLERGDTLAGAVRRHPRAFSPFFARMAEAAEGSPKPERVLEDLSRWLERADRLRRQVRTAFVYPLLVCNMLILQLVVVLGLLAPLAVFPLFGRAGPAFDKVAIAGLALALLLNWGALRSGWDSRLPWIGGLRRRAEQALWARALGSLLAAGVDVPRAARMAAETVDLPGLRNELLRCAERMDRGSTLAESLAEASRLEPVLAWTAAAGEDREDLAPLFLDAADLLDREVDRASLQVVRLAEPVALAAVGLLVACGLLLFWVPFQAGVRGLT